MSHRDFGGSCHGRHSQAFVFLSLSIPLSWGFVFTLLLSASLHPLLFFFNPLNRNTLEKTSQQNSNSSTLLMGKTFYLQMPPLGF